ncbi:MAG: hypothetical protein AB1894_23310 [Chloroflexota bacterium]
MSVKMWQPIKTCFCHHISQEVHLEAELIYPADWLPDYPPQAQAHRCSSASECNLDGRSSCVWAGTNPTVDPFEEWMKAA